MTYMGIFSKKKTQDDEKTDDKTVKVDDAKKTSGMKNLYKDKNEKSVKTETYEKKEIKRKYGTAYKILIKPLVTEKGSDLNTQNKYLFEVDKNANKIEIAKAITEVYGVKPTSINVSRVLGKTVRRGRYTGKRKNTKKAIVTLAKGDTISVYEGV